MLGMLCQWFIRSMVQLLHQIKIQITVMLSHSLKLTHPDNTTSVVLLSHQLTSIEVTKMPSLRSPYNGRGACSPSTCRVSGGSWLTPAAAQSASPVADQCMR